ncbi:hypothetical protein ATY75_12260 [Rhizobium sp. N122]|uniref:glycoside hydrolase family 24 protein n=1 Tax=Rhizobium sp. N122 TaxID=1764272 RepID=UPI000B5A642E|nr:glycoside hydrolase family 104 protein [Rhizobium sp. N122]OWV62590.1 hypothetical protein ATY75_12260 [Rhizobium sp. N122]
MKLTLPPEAIALLNTIAGPESGGSYNTIYGGQKVADLSDHPRINVEISSGPNAGKTSSAAGKYQFIKGTWDTYANKLGLKDFSPESQDQAAWALAQDAYKDATGGDLSEALRSGDRNVIAGVGKALAPIWTSLPGGIEQGTTKNRFVNSYASNIENPTNSAAAATDAMANGTIQPNLVHTVDYVPPPGSSATPQFTPLVTIPHLQPRETEDQQNTTPAPPVAPPAAPAPTGDDLMRAWGIQDTGEAPPPAAAPPSPDEQLIKAWGLDQNEQAPAAGMTGGQKREHNPIEKLITGEPQTPPISEDMGKSFGSGFVRGDAELHMLPLTAKRLLDKYATPYEVGAINSVRGLFGYDPMPVPTPEEISDNPIDRTLNAGQDTLRGAMDERLYKAKTVPGKYAGTFGEFLPGTIAFGGGNMLTNIAKYALIPSVASEAAGQFTEGTKVEPYARVGAALLAPFGVQGLLRGAEAAGNKLLTMTPKGAAANNLTAALAESGKTVDDVGFEMARNPRLNPMDVDTNLQQMGMNLANQGGGPRSIINSAVEGRAAGAKGAVTDAYDAAAGAVPDVKAYLDGLKATTRANAKQAFGDALTGAQPVDITPVLESIDNVVAPGINGVVGKVSDLPQGPVEQALARVRAKLANSNEMLTDADRLHTIQSNLRTEADTLAKSASGQDRLVADALRDVRQKIVDQIDNATGGKYRPAQKQYADDNAIQDAFDKGLEVFKGGTGKNSLENRPEYWADWVKNATPAELDAAKVGTRVAVDQTISSVRNAAAKGEAIADVDFNVARLEALLGKSETQKLVQTLKDEQKIAQTNAKIFAGSQTAPRQAANKLTEVKQITPGISLNAPIAIGGGYTVGGIPGAVAGAGLSLGRMGVQWAQQARDIARNRLMAEALSGDITRFREAVAPAGTANKLLAPIRGAQTPLLRSSGAVPLSIGTQVPNELIRPPNK